MIELGKATWGHQNSSHLHSYWFTVTIEYDKPKVVTFTSYFDALMGWAKWKREFPDAMGEIGKLACGPTDFPREV